MTNEGANRERPDALFGVLVSQAGDINGDDIGFTDIEAEAEGGYRIIQNRVLFFYGGE